MNEEQVMPTLITRDYAVSQKRTYPYDPQTSDFYASIIGSLNSDPDEADAAMLMKRAGKLSKLRVFVVTGGANGDGSVTLRKKSSGTWSTTSLSIAIPQNALNVLQEDNEHEVTFAAGDKLCWKIVSNANVSSIVALRSIIARVEDA